MRHTILLIDDDLALVNLFGKYLEKAGYKVLRANSGLAGIKILFEQRPDLIVLDLMMPRMDGWETCQRIREVSNVPIIMLTAKGDESSKLRGFKLGVDDYVTKPFSYAELAARIAAVLTRLQRSEVTTNEVLSLGGLTLDQRKRQVTRNGTVLQLSPTEFKLLAYLMKHAGEPLAAETLINDIWGPGYAQNKDYIKRYIWYLRQKIESDPSNPQLIQTERGFGYRFSA